MAVVRLPWSSSADETIASLDRLFQAESARRSDGRRALEAIVARLDAVSLAEPDETPLAPREGSRDERGRRSVVGPDPAPFVPLPRRTTHGGPFGPKVREKLTAEALSDGGWW